MVPSALAKPGWFGWQFPLGVGVAAIGAAALRAGIVAKAAGEAGQNSEAWWIAAGRIALLAPMGAALGLAAVWALSRMLKRPLGDWRLAGARMLAAVGLFHLVWRLGAAPSGWAWFDMAFAFSLGFACYLGALALTFRLKRDELLQLTSLHAGFVLAAHALVWIVPALFTVKSSTTVEQKPAPATAPEREPPAPSTPSPPPPTNGATTTPAAPGGM